MGASALLDDCFAGIHQGGSLQQRLAEALRMFRRQCSGIDRIGVALFDDGRRELSTYLAAPTEENPLRNYQARLDRITSLLETAIPGKARIVQDLDVFSSSGSEHSAKLLQLGMRSSYTLPIFETADLRGFVFLDSRQPAYFQPQVATQSGLFAHLLAQMVLNHQASVRTLVAALRVTIGMIHYRDPETGNHLERMSRIARLITQDLVRQGMAEVQDEEIDSIYRFAPLHDIGKIGIPDRILLKPAHLNSQEWSVMKSHSRIGRAIIDRLIDEFGFASLPNIPIMREIAELHHEKPDGSGYPYGLAAEEVPLAARITAVSDIFDALTSVRPYKQAWTNQAALDELLRQSDQNRVDGNCVASLQNQMDEVVEIQRRFRDDHARLPAMRLQ